MAAVVGVAIYVATLAADEKINGQIDFPELFLPVLGGPIAALRYESVVVNEDYREKHGTSEKLGLAASGVLQAACLAVILVDLLRASPSPTAPAATASTRMQVKPFGAWKTVGLSLAAAFP